MVPSHLNSPLVIVFQAYKTIPLVTSVGQPKFQRSTLLTYTSVELSDVLHTTHALTPLERFSSATKMVLSVGLEPTTY